MEKVLLDTNILILHLSGKESLMFSKFTATISTLTIFELLQYTRLTQKEEQSIHSLINICTVIPVTQEVAEFAAQLSRKYKIPTIDSLIAATALSLGIPLMTKNIKDFKKIPKLELL